MAEILGVLLAFLNSLMGLPTALNYQQQANQQKTLIGTAQQMQQLIDAATP